jgi:hypothetical protein
MSRASQATGTIRFFPGDPLRLKMKHDFCPLNNKVMELRKVGGSKRMCDTCGWQGARFRGMWFDSSVA